MSEPTSTYGDRIRLAREAKGLTQQQLGDLVFKTQPAIHFREKSDAKTGPVDELLAKVLGVDAIWLATGMDTSGDTLQTIASQITNNKLHETAEYLRGVGLQFMEFAAMVESGDFSFYTKEKVGRKQQ